MNTKLNLAILILCSSFVVCAQTAQPVFDNQKWQLISKKLHSYGPSKLDNPQTDTYIPLNSELENSIEVLQIEFIPGQTKRITTNVVENISKSDIMSMCPNTIWKSVEQQYDEIIWRFSIKNCPNHNDQSGITRAVLTKQGIHLFHYTSKKLPMESSVFMQWVKNLKHITPPQPQRTLTYQQKIRMNQ